ncbi:MAG TPA: hypothetical protein VGR89_10065, partial [Puia sp.]|nr:hypothetical protein [Puia sp.]
MPAFQAFSQTVLAGRVMDDYLQTPLEGVEVKAGDQMAQTGGDGRFRINVGARTREILLSRKGYQDLPIPAAGWIGEKIIALKPSGFNLPEVVVRAYRLDEKLLGTPGNLSLLTERDFDRGDRVNLAPVLDTLAGVRVDQAFMADSRVSLRGEGLRSGYG